MWKPALPHHFIPTRMWLFPLAMLPWMGFSICLNLLHFLVFEDTQVNYRAVIQACYPAIQSFANLVFGHIHVQIPLIMPVSEWKAKRVEGLEIKVIRRLSVVYSSATHMPTPLKKPWHQTRQEVSIYGVGVLTVSFLRPPNSCASTVFCKYREGLRIQNSQDAPLFSGGCNGLEQGSSTLNHLHANICTLSTYTSTVDSLIFVSTLTF